MDERDFKPEEPGTMAVPGSANLWCPRADSNPRGEIGDAGVDGPNPPAAPTNQKRRRSRDAVIFPGAPGRIRTVDTRFRRAVLYPLSYGGMLY